MEHETIHYSYQQKCYLNLLAIINIKSKIYTSPQLLLILKIKLLQLLKRTACLYKI